METVLVTGELICGLNKSTVDKFLPEIEDFHRQMIDSIRGNAINLNHESHEAEKLFLLRSSCQAWFE